MNLAYKSPAIIGTLNDDITPEDLAARMKDATETQELESIVI